MRPSWCIHTTLFFQFFLSLFNPGLSFLCFTGLSVHMRWEREKNSNRNKDHLILYTHRVMVCAWFFSWLDRKWKKIKLFFILSFDCCPDLKEDAQSRFTIHRFVNVVYINSKKKEANKHRQRERIALVFRRFYLVASNQIETVCPFVNKGYIIFFFLK